MRLVTVSGSLRQQSSNASLLREAARLVPAGVEVVAYQGLAALPHFNPDLDEEGATPPEPVRDVRALLAGADAVLVSSPEYAHGVPGAFKNLLDWLVSVGELAGKPVAVLNAAVAGGEYAQAAIVETLRTMSWDVVAEASQLTPFLRRRGALDDDARQLLSARVRALLAAAATRPR